MDDIKSTFCPSPTPTNAYYHSRRLLSLDLRTATSHCTSPGSTHPRPAIVSSHAPDNVPCVPDPNAASSSRAIRRMNHVVSKRSTTPSDGKDRHLLSLSSKLYSPLYFPGLYKWNPTNFTGTLLASASDRYVLQL